MVLTNVSMTTQQEDNISPCNGNIEHQRPRWELVSESVEIERRREEDERGRSAQGMCEGEQKRRRDDGQEMRTKRRDRQHPLSYWSTTSYRQHALLIKPSGNSRLTSPVFVSRRTFANIPWNKTGKKRSFQLSTVLDGISGYISMKYLEPSRESSCGDTWIDIFASIIINHRCLETFVVLH